MTASILPLGNIHVPEVVVPDEEHLNRARARAALAVTLTFWISQYLLQTLATGLSGNIYFASVTGMRILSTIVGLGFCYLIHLLLRHRRLSTTRKRLIALAIVAPVLAEIYAWAAFFALALVDPELNLSSFTWSGAVQTISFWTWFFLAWSGVYLALMYSFDVRDEQRRSAELRERAHIAQLRALHSQINPHFLFNSLNSVSALILDKDTEKAEEMVTRLASFLRLGLAADPTRKIPLGLEIRLQRSYLEIEQLRYPDLVVDFDVPGALLGALVPSLILQPIVENAVKFGVAGTPPPTTIVIKGRNANGQLELEVVDFGKGAPKTSGGGIGLANVEQRLSLIYGEGRSRLTACRDSTGAFRVNISMPMETA